MSAHVYLSPIASARDRNRAGLLLAFVAGVQIMRQMIGRSALPTAGPGVLTTILKPVFQQLWAGESRSSRHAD